MIMKMIINQSIPTSRWRSKKILRINANFKKIQKILSIDANCKMQNANCKKSSVSMQIAKLSLSTVQTSSSPIFLRLFVVCN